jgi:signal transduction histidine kinase
MSARKIIWDTKPCFAIIYENISERKLKATLTLADEKRDRIIATVSHELRTPINGILGLLKMSLERSGNDSMLGEYLTNCISCSKLSSIHLRFDSNQE